jgi:hypothetical protein
LSWDHTIPENGRKNQNNLSNGQKKSSDEQFLKAPRNWQKCSALLPASCDAGKNYQFQNNNGKIPYKRIETINA